ncbi:MAG: anti-phage ZorAB system protein ZorA [Alphaproteobacteria bacterium]
MDLSAPIILAISDAISKALASSVFSLFKHEIVAYSLTLAIFTGLIVAIGWFLSIVIMRRARQLDGISGWLKTLSSERELISAYGDLKQRVQMIPWLKHAWGEFDETLLKPADGSGSIKLTLRPSDYLSRESCSLGFPIWRALPNYFVGFGLLCTFLGLVSALYFASEAVGGDVDKAQDALGGLLKAATFKFLTSIAGLFSSIVFSFIYHHGVRSLDRAFERFCEQIERLTQFATPESIAEEQLGELKQQTVQLERFNTTIAMDIVKGLSSTLDATIADGLRRAIEPLSQSVDRLANGMANDNLGALKDMVQGFQQQLQAGAGQEFNAIASALGELRGVLRQAGDEVAKRTEGFNSDIGEAARTLNEVATRFETTFATFDEQMGQQTSAFADIAANAKGAAGELTMAARQMGEAGQPVAAAASRIEAASRDLSDLSASQKATVESMVEIGNQLAASNDAVQASWQHYTDRFDQVDTELARIFQQFAENANTYQETVRSFIVELDQNLDKAVKTLGGGIGEMTDSIEELKDALRNDQPHQTAAE